MIKDIFEDNKRHKSDKLENYKQALVYDKVSKEFVRQNWRDIQVGQIVKV